MNSLAFPMLGKYDEEIKILRSDKTWYRVLKGRLNFSVSNPKLKQRESKNLLKKKKKKTLGSIFTRLISL